MADPIVPPVAPPVVAPAVTPPAAPGWYEGKLSGEVLGHAQNKGWTTMTPDAAAAAAISAHHEAQRFIGHPADRLVKLPSGPADEAGWRAVYDKLGVPADKAAYDFSGVKFADGKALDDTMTAFVRDQAAALHLPKEGATAFAQGLTKYLEGKEVAQKAESTAKVSVERDTLAKNWGNNFEVNKFVASQAAQKLGFTAEDVTALEGVVGYSKVMEAMRRVGVTLGEDKYVAGSGASAGGMMTREQAMERRGELMKDDSWVKSYLTGDAAKVKEMTALNTILSA